MPSPGDSDSFSIEGSGPNPWNFPSDRRALFIHNEPLWTTSEFMLTKSFVAGPLDIFKIGPIFPKSK